MSTLIPEISISEFKSLKASELKQLKSCEVTSDGDYLFTFVNGKAETSGYLRTQTEYNSQRANAVSGKTLEEIKGAVLV